MAPKEFDLLPNQIESNVFKVTFDFYTPRAHFVILPRNGKTLESNDLNGLVPETRREVVRVGSSLVAEYISDKTAILSVHRGSWVSIKNKFHAHVYTDVGIYLDVFNGKEKENQIPDWPNKKFVTNKWRISQDPKEYAENVKAYPIDSYYGEELGVIKKIRLEKGTTVNQLVDKSYEGYVLVYHPSEPKVGFAVMNKLDVSLDDRAQVLNAMNKFAGAKNLTDINCEDEHKGCHLCVVFNFINHGFVMPDPNLTLLGYIQLTGVKFYKDFCSGEKKEDWFQKFSNLGDYKIYT